MCNLCYADAEFVGRIGSLSVFKAQKTSDNWKRGEYAIVSTDTPLIRFSELIAKVPSYSNINELNTESFGLLMGILKETNGELALDLITSYRIVVCAMGAGYSIEKHGTNVILWFAGKIVNLINNKDDKK